MVVRRKFARRCKLVLHKHYNFTDLTDAPFRFDRAGVETEAEPSAGM